MAKKGYLADYLLPLVTMIGKRQRNIIIHLQILLERQFSTLGREKLESRRRIMVIDPINKYPLSDQSWGELGGHFMLRDLPYQSLYF